MRFKDSCNRWLTSGLFYELRDNKSEFAVFTTWDEDREVEGRTLLSLKRLFLSCDDPTEYEFANKYLGGWGHWKALQESPVVAPLVEAWREEWDVKTRARAWERIIDISKSEKGFQAAKVLADRGWRLRTAGAPSKAEKEGLRKQDRAVDSMIQADADRLGILKVVK